MWQGQITNEFSASTAADFGNAHEMNPNADLGQMTFAGKDALDQADMHVDLLNNIIGREIGDQNKGLGMRDLAIKVLDRFATKGLWTAQKQKDGSYKISLTKITSTKYSQLKNRFMQLNDNGRTKKGQEEADKRQREIDSQRREMN